MKNENVSTLKVNLLGEFHVSLDNNPIRFTTRESESTCAFLMLNRQRSFDRKRVLEILFPELNTSCAQKRLRNDIWRIKSGFEALGLPVSSYFQISNRDIGFLPTANVWIDLEEFEQAADSCAEDSPTIDNILLIEKMELYKGGLLEGFYQEWCIWEKERIEMQYLYGLEILMNSFNNNKDWQRAIELGKQLILRDPLREHVHRQLMRFFYALGDRPAAIKQYFECRDRLALELSVDPMQSTQELFMAIENETLARESRSPAANSALAEQIDEIHKKVNEIKLLANSLNQISIELDDRFKL